MKKITTLLFVSSLLLFLSGCVQDICNQTVTYTVLEPVYISFEEMRKSIGTESPRDLKHPGKIYYWNNYIFISEFNEGIHVINNLNPDAPQNIAFIKVLGIRDLAVKGNIIYADAYMDLLSIDISDPMQAQFVSRVQDVFPYDNWQNGAPLDPTLGVVKEWVAKEVTENVDCSSSLATRNEFVLFSSTASGLVSPTVDFNASSGSTTGVESFANAPEGVGGSMARFAITGSRLYVVTDQDLVSFNIDDLSNPVLANRTNVGFGIETIFPYKENLFIGSQTGMFIYDLVNPDNPSYVSEFQHMRNCDPVAIEGNTAYVTLRSGNGCPGTANQLHVIDITDLANPNRLAIYNMTNPAGLGIRNGTLFICDGNDGLKVFDAEDPMRISFNQLAHYGDIHAMDVIPLENILLMIGEDGLYQYDYSDVFNIRQISSILVVK